MSTATVNHGFEQNLNPEFRRVVRSFKKALPYVAILFLFVVYAVSSWAGGAVLSKLTETTLVMGVVLAYAISTTIQVGRMVLVFYPLLNPVRPSQGFVSEFTGILLGVISIVEIWTLVFAAGINQAIAVSISMLMGLGVIAELYLLKEIKLYVKMDLLSNGDYAQKLRDYFIAAKQFDQLLENLETGSLSDEELAIKPIATVPKRIVDVTQEDTKEVAEASKKEIVLSGFPNE